MPAGPADLIPSSRHVQEELEPPASRRPSPWLLAGVATAALAWGFVYTIASHTPYGLYWFSTVLVGWAFIGAGLAGWWTRPGNRTGPLMVLCGFLFLLPSLIATQVPVLWTIGSALGNAFGVVLFYLLLSYPRGVLGSRLDRVVVWLAAIGFVGIVNLVAGIGFDPRTAGCTDCPAGLNLLQFVETPPAIVDWLFRYVGLPLGLLALAMLTAMLISRWIRASKPARRILWPVYLPAVIFGLDNFQGIIVFNYFGDSAPDFSSWGPYVTLIDLLLLPVTFLIGLVRLRVGRRRVADLAVDLWEGDAR